ncbi:MAG: alternative oxidase [Alphaproteobacteria bacterium]
MDMIPQRDLNYTYNPKTLGERAVRSLAIILRRLADFFFRKRYGHRAVFIETIAAVPGMVGGALLHFRCLRKIKNDQGWIRQLLDEAENERMHLMVFIQIAQPTLLEHCLIYVAQFFFVVFYAFFYMCSSRLAHRFVGHLEEEAIHSYSEYLKLVLQGTIENVPAPDLGIRYWKLKKNACLSDLIIAVREDERHHRDVNHYLSDKAHKL